MGLTRARVVSVRDGHGCAAVPTVAQTRHSLMVAMEHEPCPPCKPTAQCQEVCLGGEAVLMQVFEELRDNLELQQRYENLQTKVCHVS